jgi:hypothetical protein
MTNSPATGDAPLIADPEDLDALLARLDKNSLAPSPRHWEDLREAHDAIVKLRELDAGALPSDSSPTAGYWRISRADGDDIWGEYSWFDGGQDPAAPKWEHLVDVDADPTEYIAEWCTITRTITETHPPALPWASIDRFAVHGTATTSGDGTCRYELTRYPFDHAESPRPAGTVVFVMLNPSTADHELNDPTIRRCLGFARRERFHKMVVVNLFATICTTPADLAPEPAEHAEVNDEAVSEAFAYADVVIAAWGATVDGDVEAARRIERIRELTKGLYTGVLYRLGEPTKFGHPRHPLYLRADTELMEHVLPVLPPRDPCHE